MAERQERDQPNYLHIVPIHVALFNNAATIWDGMDGYMIEELLIKIISMEKVKLLNVLVMFLTGYQFWNCFYARLLEV